MSKLAKRILELLVTILFVAAVLFTVRGCTLWYLDDHTVEKALKKLEQCEQGQSK